MDSSEDAPGGWATGDPEEGDNPTEHGGRGWVPPEERAWRHPSELGSRSTWAPVSKVGAASLAPVGRRAAWATALIGAGAVAALVSGGFMLASQSKGASPDQLQLATPPVAATRSIVRLAVTSSNSTGYGCGIVVAKGGMIATDASSLVPGGRVTAVTASGRREHARVIAVDLASDVGLVKIPTSLPVARFVDWSRVRPGSNAVEMAVQTVSPGETTSAWWEETIDAAGEAVGSGPGAGMASVVASAPHGAQPDGAVLMQQNGAVVGILDRSGVPAAGGGGSVFLPGQFVREVAHKLMTSNGHVLHGWLGIKGTNTSSNQPKGALVTSVVPGGAADHHLETGDVIEAVNGHRVRSMADLRSRLYLLAPGAWVDLRVERSDAVLTIGMGLRSTV